MGLRFYSKFSSGLSYIFLQVQRTLQLRIEEHARYLEKMLNEQQKAGSALLSPLSLATVTNACPEVELQPLSQPAESKTDSSAQPSSKHKVSDTSNPEQQESQKRPRIESKPQSDSSGGV